MVFMFTLSEVLLLNELFSLNGAMKVLHVAAESLIAEIDNQSNLATPRRESRKIQCKMKFSW
jgi:hypothetical protein